MVTVEAKEDLRSAIDQKRDPIPPEDPRRRKMFGEDA